MILVKPKETNKTGEQIFDHIDQLLDVEPLAK